MSAYDIKRELKALYAPRNQAWELLDVPKQQFLAINGSGNPNTAADYATAVQALYTLIYKVKFANKHDAGRDFVVGPLEGLWWSDKPGAFTTGAKDTWQWTMLISLPDWISETLIETARQTVLTKKDVPAIREVHLLTLTEGRCAQAFHVGPYDDEGPLLAELHGPYFCANDLTFDGLHHEIYIGDPRRASPTKLKTVLRQPVRPKQGP